MQKEEAYTVYLKEIFNQDENIFEQIDSSEIPDNILCDILDQTANSLQQKPLESESSFIGADKTSRSSSTSKTPSRFKVISKEDVDEIAGKSCKKRTHKQTEWGVKVFLNEWIFDRSV